MKLVIFLIMLPFLLPIIVAAFFILRIFLKGKAEGWKGEILDKSHNTKRDDENIHKINHFYSLRVRMENGSERNIAVSGEFYQTCNIGDTIEKPKGAIFPKKI
jgi:hypothetical protein